MEPNIEVCKTIAVQHGLPLQFVVKEFRVFDVLAKIVAATAGRKDFVFKGGTALSKVYLGGVQRFSEDLDFDLEAQGIAQVKKFCRMLAKEMEGCTVGEMRKVRGTVQFYCVFENGLGGKDNVRVDVAQKKVMHAKPLEIRPAVSSYAQISVSGFCVYSLEDLVARKMNALCERCEGKDIYDVHNAIGLCGKMRGALEKMLASEGSRDTPGRFLRKTIEAVEKADAKKISNVTNPFIPSANRPKDWLALKNDLVLRLERLLKEVEG